MVCCFVLNKFCLRVYLHQGRVEELIYTITKWKSKGYWYYRGITSHSLWYGQRSSFRFKFKMRNGCEKRGSMVLYAFVPPRIIISSMLLNVRTHNWWCVRTLTWRLCANDHVAGAWCWLVTHIILGILFAYHYAAMIFRHCALQPDFLTQKAHTRILNY